MLICALNTRLQSNFYSLRFEYNIRLQQQPQHLIDEINPKIDLVDENGGVDLILTKFELYAEFVHRYLPQIRQHNKYLLFHYIWTMQVRYLTPFFNYICDLYQAYD